MPTPYLIADSAQVTVLRSLASTAFGKYGLKLPEGVNLEDVYEVAAPGNELAYVSSLGSARRVGGMFRRFVRADVSVTAQGEDMVPASDVERVLDEAAKRVSGDFFLESDISKAGLGPWVPFVDFHVGDIANVEIWGRVVPLAVTRIEPKRTEHSDNDWSVHVGGQLLSDSEARLAENADIYNAVVSDRRDLAGVEAKASRAATAASTAQSTANTARSEVQAVRDTLAGEQAQEPDLLSQLVAVNDELQRLGQDPQPSLMLAFISLSTALWEQQQRINQQQQEINAQQKKIDAAQDDAAKAIQQSADAARDLATKNGVLLAKLDDLQREISRKSVGKVTLKGGKVARSGTHKLGIRMPSYDRDLYLVVMDDFVGTVTAQIFYSNGDAYQKEFKDSDFYPRAIQAMDQNYFKDFFRPTGDYLAAYWQVPLGNIDSATFLVDHVTWS